MAIVMLDLLPFTNKKKCKNVDHENEGQLLLLLFNFYYYNYYYYYYYYYYYLRPPAQSLQAKNFNIVWALTVMVS